MELLDKIAYEPRIKKWKELDESDKYEKCIKVANAVLDDL